jgi:hypothetical protein
MKCVEVVVEKLRLIFHKKMVFHPHILSKLLNFLNIRWVTHQIKLVKAFLVLTLCYQVHIQCLDGKLLKVNPWINSLKVLLEVIYHPVQKPMNSLQKIESCVFKFTSRSKINIILPTFLMLKPLQMPQIHWLF